MNSGAGGRGVDFMSKFDGFVFDLDGTLVDTFRDLQTAVNLVRADEGLEPLDLETVTSYVGYGARQLIRKAIGECTPERETALVLAFRKHYKDHLHDRSRLYPNVRETLDRLSGHGLAVLSNKPQEAADELLRKLGVHDLFQIVRGQDDLWPAKPDPSCLLYIVREVFRTTPDRTLMVGDFDTDVLTARNAGVPCAIVRTGMSMHMAVEPDWYIDDISELSRQD